MIFLIVGPSGSGKDTLIDYVTARLPIEKVRRRITRPNNPHEDFDSVSPSDFDQRDHFISWEAHGNKYGIPLLNPNKNYIMNVSRKVIKEIKNKEPNTTVIKLDINKEVLKQRMIARGRDSLEEMEKRLARDIEVESDIIIDNSQSPASIAGEQLVNFLRSKLL